MFKEVFSGSMLVFGGVFVYPIEQCLNCLLPYTTHKENSGTLDKGGVCSCRSPNQRGLGHNKYPLYIWG